ncbi:ABC transporter ATP-binding protein [Pseudobutyrivibrio xylanivorans]|uniref:ABC-type polysaccharide/polyol phosphate transport system, ATPase component n=1 Tax=Pseudobutyrivibrio xylanivorans DSM 14809 TaxID=1123012 RepID=A0A1M6IK92_PSEXY|nr:ABC transporter ATP-binding protein [Pseudobutyrivibrio xylanivorans]SHJ34838.1 ABC-type polysaccharide/polyol phosphate transport system, ATPase component [Pseudobutyrivibrio xylanivorans DSM 14809]
MTNNDVVLKIENVGKDYILGTVTGETLKDALRQRRKNKKGADDELQVHNKVFTALDDVSLEIRRGECVGLIGSNGAGKSTLLKLISRITSPSRGRIYIDGKVSSMLEVGTGFHPELTGRENIYLNGSILGMRRQEIDAKLDSIIEFSECQEFIDTPVKRYSSGMYVKLAFSVAAHLDSDIMIMDEVLAVGDIKFQHKCLDKMREIAKTEGRTILYVSHNMETVHNLCDRCIVLQHGKLAFDGSVEEAVKKYNGVDVKTETTSDYAGYMRPGWLQRDDVRLTWAEYPDKDNNVFTDDKMRILIKYKNIKEVQKAGIRVEFMSDTDHPFATQVFDNVVNGMPGDEGEFEVVVDLSKIQPGTYQTFYTVYVLNPYDDGVDLDCVRGLDVTIEREHIQGELKWRANSWGSIKL